MDNIEKLTRELGKAIQLDERYLNYVAARQKNEKDDELNDLLGQVQIIHMNYGREAQKGDEADQDKLDEFEKNFNELFSRVKNHPTMVNYENARDELDSLMKYVTGILSMCAVGEDPMTCDPQANAGGCAGDCSSCGGCG
ncbi:MAG: YlbF family regulator [Clostridia bacterium]|nr:YlbF family regulator [Clostridia bacterium]